MVIVVGNRHAGRLLLDKLGIPNKEAVFLWGSDFQQALGLPPETKVYSVFGADPYVLDELKKRGHTVENVTL